MTTRPEEAKPSAGPEAPAGAAAAILKSSLLTVSVVAVGGCLVLAGVTVWNVVSSADALVSEQARQVAEAVVLQNRAMQAVYARAVVKTGDAPAPELATLPGGLHADRDLPLPPIFTRRVAQESRALGGGGESGVRLVDGWGVNPDNARGLDAFERRGWDSLLAQAREVLARSGSEGYARAIRAHGWKPVTEIAEVDGRRVLRYLTAQTATEEACVRCHNGMAAGPALAADHEGDGPAPGRLVLGDPLGAIEVQVPLDRVDLLANRLRNRMIALFLLVAGAGAVFIVLLMRRSASVAVERLTGVTRDALGRITGAVADVASAAEAQGKNITRQAAALQETQVTTQELKQTSEMVYAKTEAILAVAERAESLGATGEATVSQTLAALTDIRSQVGQIAEKIERLSDWTSQVGDITQTVKDLADQSNMLALNAAIEAVRSGEHGKGFAVVAREIRTLADQSVQATGRVREILETIGAQIREAVGITQSGAERIEGGLVQVKASGDHIKELSGIVKSSTAAVRQIAAAVSQQNAGVSQIFTAVTDQNGMMEDTVRQIQATRAAVGVASGVSAELSRLAESFHL